MRPIHRIRDLHFVRRCAQIVLKLCRLSMARMSTNARLAVTAAIETCAEEPVNKIESFRMHRCDSILEFKNIKLTLCVYESIHVANDMVGIGLKNNQDGNNFFN